MAFTCDKHGFILYGNSCLNCEREQEPITPPIPRKSPLENAKDGDEFIRALQHQLFIVHEICEGRIAYPYRIFPTPQ